MNELSPTLNEAKGRWWWLATIGATSLLGPLLIAGLEPPRASLMLVGTSIILLALVFLIAVFLLKPDWFQPSIECPRWYHLALGLIHSSFLGWAIFEAGVIVAVTSATRIMGSSPPLTFSGILDHAAPDISRAAVIALIVVFFVEMQRHHRDAVDKTAKAAEDATQIIKIVPSVNETMVEARKAIQEAKKVAEETIKVLKTAPPIFGADTLANTLGRMLDAAYKQQSLTLFGELADDFYAYIKRFHNEVLAHPEDLFEFIAISALMCSYLKTERLNFIGDDVGTGGCQFNTHFAHYALAVRGIVDALESSQRGRYRYFTVLNKSPRRFFNVENQGADPNWSINFLEEFCRRHHNEKIPYVRYFLANSYSDTDRLMRELPNWQDVRDNLDSNILCYGVNGRPVLWSKQKFDGEDDLYQEVKICGEKFGLREPSYVIDDQKNKLSVSKNKLATKPVRDVLWQYHHPEIPPQFLCFKGFTAYKAFFQENLPRDIFAVWDSERDGGGKPNGWCLCLGVMIGGGDAVAVRLIFATRRRAVLDNLSWRELEEKLDLLFRETDGDILNRHDIVIRDLSGNDVGRDKKWIPL